MATLMIIFALATAYASPAHATCDLKAIASDAYVYGYPLVLMDSTRAAFLAQPGARANQFVHERTPAGPGDHSIERASVDTLASNAWLDLAKEPLVLHVPDTDGHAYLLQLLEGWTNVFADPGSRSTGGRESEFLIAGPTWAGVVPEELTLYRSPTNMAWIKGWTRIDGDDLGRVHEIQDGYTLVPLSQWHPRRHDDQDDDHHHHHHAGGEGLPPPPPVDFPAPPPDVPPPSYGQQGGKVPNGPKGSEGQLLAPPGETTRTTGAPTPREAVASLKGHEFFARLSKLMCESPASVADQPALERFRRIGFEPCQGFKPGFFSSHAVSCARDRALRAIAHEAAQLGEPANGWRLSLHDSGEYGTGYATRAAMAFSRLGASLPADLVAASVSLDGRNSYVLRFAGGSLPPVDAFWTLTLYDEQGFLVANALSRYSFRGGDGCKRNADGSLELYIQSTTPGIGLDPNWLPAPLGAFQLALRLYSPGEAVLRGQWKPPGLMKR